MEFLQLCACGPSGYALLKQRVDACAGLGRSYQFDRCRLPPGCAPAQAQMGFWRTGEDYLLYFRPAVAYQGPDPRLRDFFAQGEVLRFSGFQSMVDCLRGLDALQTAPLPNSLFHQLTLCLQEQVLGQEQAVTAEIGRAHV